MAARKLQAFVYVDGQAYGPGSDVPAEVAKQITNPKAWGEEPQDNGEAAGGQGDEVEVESYDDLKVAELEAEVARRIEAGADIQVDGSGKDGKVLKKDLVAALEADDDAAEDSDES